MSETVAGLPADLVDRFLDQGFTRAQLQAAAARLRALAILPDARPAPRDPLDIHFLPVSPIALYLENQRYA